MAWPKEISFERYPSDLSDEKWFIVEPILENGESLYHRKATKS